MNNNNLNELENEFDEILKSHYIPASNWIPYKKENKKENKKVVKKDKITMELEKDLNSEYLKELEQLQNKYKKEVISQNKILRKTEKTAKKLTKKNIKLGFDYDKTINEKLNIKDVIKQRTKNDKTALGGAFKISYINFDENNKLTKINEIKKRVENKIQYEYINSDKKYNYVCFITFKYEIETGGHVKEIRYFNSSTFTITSMNIIKNFIENSFDDFVVDLEGAKLNSGTLLKNLKQ